MGSRLHTLIHALPILESAFGSISFPTRLGNTLDSRLHILIHCRLGNQPESNTLGSRQKRTLRQPSRQPIRIEHYVNRVVSQSESNITSPESSANQNRALRHPSRHYVTPESSRLGVRTLLVSRLESAAIAYLNTWRVLTPPCSPQLTLLLLSWLLSVGGEAVISASTDKA